MAGRMTRTFKEKVWPRVEKSLSKKSRDFFNEMMERRMQRGGTHAGPPQETESSASARGSIDKGDS